MLSACISFIIYEMRIIFYRVRFTLGNYFKEGWCSAYLIEETPERPLFFTIYRWMAFAHNVNINDFPKLHTAELLPTCISNHFRFLTLLLLPLLSTESKNLHIISFFWRLTVHLSILNALIWLVLKKYVLFLCCLFVNFLRSSILKSPGALSVEHSRKQDIKT